MRLWSHARISHQHCRKTQGECHYHAALQIAKRQSLIATLPSKAAKIFTDDPDIVLREPPFDIPPIALKMAWSALLHHDAGHIWLRRLIGDVAAEMQ